VGASGAGKSLLAHAIVGLLPPNAAWGGTMRFCGEPLDAERQARLRGRYIALVPQSIAYLDPLVRAERQVAWAAERAGIPQRSIGSATRAAMERFHLDQRALRAFPHELSGGMARRLLLAIATVADADLVIADEPTTGLDERNVSAVMDHLRTIADCGKAVLVITHDLHAVLPVADRITVLCDGRTVETAPAAAFTGCGEALGTDYARALWRALPQNDFASPRHSIAA
jgi:peptide/nickel transport system ATP-binding protein